MHRVTLPGLGAETSWLGFGCASLGSRIGAAQGHRALAQGFEAGVRWFDVAPSYGAGEAEAILGAFLKGRRDEALICTKVGLAPPAQSGAKKLLRTLLRPVVARAAGVRRAIRRSGATANRAVPLSADLVRSSIDGSLARLGTDHVDVYALHNARPDDLARDDILRALEDVLASGKTRAVSVAGKADTAAAAIARGAPFGVVQFAQPGAGAAEDPVTAPGPGLFAAAAAAGMGCVTHSVFGVDGNLRALTARIAAEADLRAALAAQGFDGDPAEAAAAVLLARARASNPDGVVLASMFSPRSLAANLAEAARAPRPEAARLLAEAGL